LVDIFNSALYYGKLLRVKYRQNSKQLG